MALEATLGTANLLQLAEALSINAERVSHELEQSPHRGVTGKNTTPTVYSSNTEAEETSRPPIPELSRIAWTAYSNIGSARNETRPVYRLPPEILALVIGFCQSKRCRRAYSWVQLILVSRMWKTTMLSFPSLWSKLVLNASIPQSGILTLADRSGSHPLQVEIPSVWSGVYPRSNRYKLIRLAFKLLPRVSRLTIDALDWYDACRVRLMFRDRTANQLLELKLMASFLDFVVHAPRLRSLSISCMKTWPPPPSENITHICLDTSLNPDILQRGLKNCPRLEELSIIEVHQPVERPRDRPTIRLLPGVRLVIKDSHTTVASLFALGSTNYLSIRATFVFPHLLVTSFLEQVLPQDISHLRNLVDPTIVYLRLADNREHPDKYDHQGITMTLKCSAGDRETLFVEVGYYALHRHSPDPMEMEIVPEQSPAMSLLDYLVPLYLREVVELRMEGFVGEWDLQSLELGRFLKRMPALRRIVTSDDNKGKFSLALLTMERNVIIEGV